MQQLWKFIWQFFRINGVAVSLDPAILLMSVNVTIVVMIHQDQGTWVAKGLFSLHFFSSAAHHCSQDRNSNNAGAWMQQFMQSHSQDRNANNAWTWMQQFMQKLQKGAAMWFSLHHLVCFLTKPWTTSSGLATCTIRQTILHQLDLM